MDGRPRRNVSNGAAGQDPAYRPTHPHHPSAQSNPTALAVRLGALGGSTEAEDAYARHSFDVVPSGDSLQAPICGAHVSMIFKRY